MAWFRNQSLRQWLVFVCLITAAVAWQNGAAKPFFVSMSSDSHTLFADGGQPRENHVSINDSVYHHCPNCAVHLLALGLSGITIGFPDPQMYEADYRSSFNFTVKAPPTPPPNS